ncbi:MAG: sel1 repeat family protein [Gammaproteobacteria bacterium]|nr:sel1 repeat family protein [Gammaproteobacteria bacterium]
MMQLNEEEIMDLNSGLKALEDKHFTRAVQLLSPLAEKGVPEAQHRMAVMYQNGLGIHRNETAAALWMKLSADQDYELAWHGMGFMYMEGEGVEKNAEEAIKWFTKGVDAGLIGSMTTLAMMYKDGNGVEKNPEEAERLLKLAGF